MKTPDWRRPIIAIDFDGCLCGNNYPDIGDPNWDVIEEAKQLQKDRAACLILWTCRTGEKLEAAIEACRTWGLEFDYINENAPWAIEEYGSDCRKISAWEYWDDSAVFMGNPLWRSIRGASCSTAHRKDVRKFVSECLRPAIDHYDEERERYAEKHPGEGNPYFDFVSISREALEFIEILTTEMDEQNHAHNWYKDGYAAATENAAKWFSGLFEYEARQEKEQSGGDA